MQRNYTVASLISTMKKECSKVLAAEWKKKTEGIQGAILSMSEKQMTVTLDK